MHRNVHFLFFYLTNKSNNDIMNISNERKGIKMASRMITQKTLFLNEKDYKTFLDFIFLISDLASNLDDKELDELQASIEQFVEKVDVEMEED